MKPGCEGKPKIMKKRADLPVLPAEPAAPVIPHSSKARWRAAALIGLNVLMVAHIVQWKIMGTTVSPIEPSESMFTLQRGAVNAGFIFFSLAILATLIFGRFVCGWGCHIVALQDLCGWILKKIGLTPRPFRSRLLIFVPLIVALYMFVWPTFARFLTKPKNEPLIPEFTNHLVTTEFWATFPTVAVAIPFLFICGFMTVYFLGQKGFCTYACPYGGFFGVADKFAPGKIRVTDACNQCGHCTAVCTSNVLVHSEVKQFGMVVDPGCMKCLDCISVCPNDALYFGLGKPTIAVSGAAKARNYSLTWPEEILAAIIFFASFMAVWDVYQLVPMLMALGIATVTTFLTVRMIKLLRTPHSAFYGRSLRFEGKVTAAGWAFTVFSALWIGLNAHSGYVRYHERAAAIAFEQLVIPDELALAQPDPKQWLSPADTAAIAQGTASFNAANRVALFTNKEAISKLAWLEYLAGDTKRAVDTLQLAAQKQSGQNRVLSLYYRGAILNRLGRHREALTNLDEAISERPDLVTAREERGEALWQMGAREQAMQSWNDALRLNASMPLTNYILAGAHGAKGDAETAAKFEQQADRATPNNPAFHWMLGLRLMNLKFTELAEKRFSRAIELDPSFASRR
jgi:polyferredoxin/tetratricopeptide (TPR) repeat protein